MNRADPLDDLGSGDAVSAEIPPAPEDYESEYPLVSERSKRDIQEFGLNMVDDYRDFKRVHLQRRCQKLYQHGLVRQVGNGVYMLSEEGQQYLDGELDAAELEPDNDEKRQSPIRSLFRHERRY